MSESDEREAERRSRSPALCQRLLSSLMTQSDLTPAEMSKSSKVLVKILSALDERLHGEEAVLVQRGLLCSVASLVTRAVGNEVPVMAREQAFLVLVLLAKLHERERPPGEERAEEEDVEGIEERRSAASEKITGVFSELLGNSLMQCSRSAVDAATALECATKACDEAVLTLPDLAASACAVDLLRSLVDSFAAASLRFERSALLHNLGNEDEFDHVGVSETTKQTAEGIAALLRAAESDAGKMVLNDMLVSFWAPLRLLSLRRTLLMSQKVASKCAENDLAMVTEAHTLAQRGVESVYATAQDETTKAACVLSALAVTLAKSEAEVRRGDAFFGRVQLPFLATRPKRDVESILVLVEDCDTWCVVRRAGGGGASIVTRRRGLAGLEAIVVRMSREKRAARLI